jgi:hypothetical protein
MYRNPLRYPVALALFALAVLVASPSTALAAKPVPFEFEVNESFTVTDVCAFPYSQTLVGTIQGTTRFDAAGNPVSEIAQIHLDGTFEANGIVVPFIIRGADHVSFNADGSVTVITSGITGRAVVPGHGLVGGSIGRLQVTFPADGSEPIVEVLSGQNNDEEFFGGILCDLLTP